LPVTALNTNYQRSTLDIEGKYNQRYDTAVHNCKNISLRVKTGDQTTLITKSEQLFRAAKSGCCNVSSNTHRLQARIEGVRLDSRTAAT